MGQAKRKEQNAEKLLQLVENVQCEGGCLVKNWTLIESIGTAHEFLCVTCHHQIMVRETENGHSLT